MFIIRTIMQPLLLVFVFTYVFPKIGQGVGGVGGEAAFSTPARAPAWSAIAMHVPGGAGRGPAAGAGVRVHARDRGPRDGAAADRGRSAIEKIVAGTIQGIFAALVVFPLAAFIPATAVHLDVQWLVLLTLAAAGRVLSAPPSGW